MNFDISLAPRSHVGLTREDILKFPFPYKLWILISMPNGFLRWNEEGTAIELKVLQLQEYLNSSQSIFVIRSSAKFLEHLKDFQFERKEGFGSKDGPGVELTFQHKYFQRQRLDLVGKIRRITFFNLDNAQSAEAMEASKSVASSGVKSARMRGDLCFLEHGPLCEMEKKRIQRETLVNFARESKLLQEKLKRAEAVANFGSTHKRGRSACLEKEQIVMLPKNMYENPHDSVLAGKGGFQGSNYGGYYGNCTVEQIEQFFGDYLPKYSDNGVLKVKEFKENANFIDRSAVQSTASIAQSTSAAISDSELAPQTSNDSTESHDYVPNLPGNVAPAANLNISATFNCDSGAMEYNIVECPTSNAMNPQYFVDPVNENEGTLNQTAETPMTWTTNPSEENKDFYDDLRATFELLQNQSF